MTLQDIAEKNTPVKEEVVTIIYEHQERGIPSGFRDAGYFISDKFTSSLDEQERVRIPEEIVKQIKRDSDGIYDAILWRDEDKGDRYRLEGRLMRRM